MTDEESILCPSARCDEGAILLGIVKEDGHVSFLGNKKLSVDSQFVQIAKQGRAPEKRFRFASNCVMNGCTQWKDNRCKVVDKVINKLSPEYSNQTELPECSIRQECRWYRQSGAGSLYNLPRSNY